MTEDNRSTPFNMKLADVVIRIEPLYDYIQEYCKDYISNESEQFVVRIESEDIEFERERSKKEIQNEVGECFSDAYLETLAVYRKIAERMPEFSIVLFHGSVISMDGVGYLFTAKSGTGKSTHARLWREYFGERAVMINDDKPLLEVTDNGVVAYGTPWNGKHRLSTNSSVLLKAICILTRANENQIKEIEPIEVYTMLLQQCYRPFDRDAMERTLHLLDKLMQNTGFFHLGCNMESDAAKTAYEGMQ